MATTYATDAAAGPKEHRFSPYTDSGGSSMAIAGDDFCVLAADTRHSEGYNIITRYSPKLYKLTEKTVLATTGMHADAVTLVKTLKIHLQQYEDNHGKFMSTSAIAQLLAVTLYRKRFFPYYVFNILGGVDDEGKGAVYSYDPVGSFEREPCRAGGSAVSILQPFLDNQVVYRNQKQNKIAVTKERAVALAKDSFAAAAERDIYTGDYLQILVIDKNGVSEEKIDLRKD